MSCLRAMGILILSVLLVSGSVSAQIAPTPIQRSMAMPLVGQPVMLCVPEAGGQTCRIADAKGKTTDLALDATGHANWMPARYGKYHLQCGPAALGIWVLARPMLFHWWDGTAGPRYATVVMAREKLRDYCRIRGIIPVHWAVGESQARPGQGPRRFTRSEQWLESWYGNVAQKQSGGIALDELFGGDRPETLAICQAIALLRQKAGPEFCISVYFSGVEDGFAAGAQMLKDAGVIGMEENYWGDEKLYRKRWNDIRRYGLERQTVFSLAPGFKDNASHVSGPLNVADVRACFAMSRRTAPEAPGISIFNAYHRPDLDAAADQAIEDYFLKPVVSLVPVQDGENKNVAAWNIGNEDAAGFLVQWLDQAGKALSPEIPLPTLLPQGKALLAIPPDANSLRLLNPPDTVNLYPDGKCAV